MTLNLDFTKAQVNKRQDLLKLFTDSDIFACLLHLGSTEELDLRKNYTSTIRPSINPDTRPSLTFNLSKEGKIIYSDWGIGSFGDAFDYALAYYNNRDKTFYTNTVVSNLLLEDVSKFKVKRLNIEKGPLITNEKRNYGYKIEPMLASDINYWKQFGIDYLTLIAFNVRRVGLIYDLDTGLYLSRNTDKNPIYVYEKLGKSETSFQLYRPLADKYSKFRNIFKEPNIIFGENKLRDDTDTLVITKSMKDMLAMYGRNFDVVAIPSESLSISKQKMDKWKDRYSTIYLLFDNDMAGKDAAFDLCVQHQISPKFIPELLLPSEKKPKDFSDYYCFSATLAEEFLNEFN